MLLWIIFAGLTATTIAILLMPVFARRTGGAAGRGSFDVAVYRDQLAELDRDEAAGLIGKTEAAAARNEVSRRILNAADTAADLPAGHGAARRAAAIIAIVGIPAICLSVYLTTGRPDLPGQPRQERMAKALERNDIQALVAAAEAHLAKNPNDADGWKVLAPIYRRLGRFTEAATAMKRVIEIEGASAPLLTEYAESLVLANNGLVSADASTAFEQALKLDASHTKARFYRALGASQDGRREQALAEFEDILKQAPSNAPWRSAVERQIAALSSSKTSPGPTREQVKAAEQMSPQDRTAMIRGMVDQLADRLKTDGSDLDGWLRLVNARMVLGERDKALEALTQAEAGFKSDGDALQRIKQLRSRLGL